VRLQACENHGGFWGGRGLSKGPEELNTMAAERPKRRGKHTTKKSAKRLVIAKRREQAAKLHVAGWSVREIAGHLKCSIGTVSTDLGAVLVETNESAVAAIARQKAMSLARLERAVKGIWPSVENGDLDAVRELVRIEARRAKVVGFDAADKLEMSGPREEPIKVDARSALLERLAGLIAGAAAGGGPSQDPSKPKPEGG
jgi:hypothetical protein